MTEGPIPALRALPMVILGDLARALRSGHLPQEASSFMIRYSVPSASELAAAELSSLLAAGVSLDHAALVLDIVAAERRSEVRRAEMELVTSGPDNSGSTRDTGVVLRESFSQVENRILIVGFAVHQGRDIFAVLADRMFSDPISQSVSVSISIVRRVTRPHRPRCCAGSRSDSFGMNGRDLGFPKCFTILGAW